MRQMKEDWPDRFSNAGMNGRPLLLSPLPFANRETAMRRRLAIALLIAVACWVATASRVSAKPVSAQDEVLAADKARMDALVAQDRATLKKILADDLVYCHSGGNVQTKEQYLAGLADGSTRYYKVETNWNPPHVVGKIGVLSGHVTFYVRAGQTDRTFHLQAASVYEKRDGRWQLILFQSTSLPASASGAASGASSAK